MKIASHKT